ncbi:hypothetical protein Y032_0165g40 [Ancylostoma ceylanicum]|uniref:Uncharacterized protein n=1 Tax=Ancylostoma ceylanicum TaxID=53326 RepID=A0A016SWY6_9BILA|nr:hypothetical protein Y032_0165g40 [Ancylostoma ceylanicum]
MQFLTLISNPEPRFPAELCIVSFTYFFPRRCDKPYSCMGPRLCSSTFASDLGMSSKRTGNKISQRHSFFSRSVTFQACRNARFK